MPKSPPEEGRKNADYMKHIKEERYQGRYLAGPATDKSELVKDVGAANTKL